MFLVCGEALFDMFLRPDESHGLCLDAVPGGSPFNVALGLARLGQRAEFFSGLSGDLMGRKMNEFIAREHIGTTYAVRSKQPTALAIVGLDENGGPDYAFYGDFPAYRAITEADLPALGDEIRVIHFGSFTTVMEPVGPTHAVLAERECGRRLIAYDPNVRPSLEPDLDLWRRTVNRYTASAHIVKVSSEDLALLYPGESIDALARRLLDGQARLVVVTGGRDGAKGWTRSAEVAQPATRVDVVDTVGAGDSYQAALLAGLAEMNCDAPDAIDALGGDALAHLLDFAGRAAAYTCGRRGADLPHRVDIDVPRGLGAEA